MSVNLDYNRIGKNAAEDAAIFGTVTAATGLWAQHSSIKNADEFISGVKNSGIKSFLVKDTFGENYEEQLREVSKKGKFNFKSLAKETGKTALVWACIGAAFETFRQVFFKD